MVCLTCASSRVLTHTRHRLEHVRYYYFIMRLFGMLFVCIGAYFHGQHGYVRKANVLWALPIGSLGNRSAACASRQSLSTTDTGTDHLILHLIYTAQKV